METVYRTSVGFKIIYLVLGAGCLGFAIFLFNIPNKSNSPWIYAIPLLLSAGGILIITNQFRRKLTISDTAITYIYIFKNTTISFDQIKGYRMGEKVISIESNRAEDSKIIINDYISLEDDNSLTDWLITNFKDLDETDLASDHDTLLHDAKLGDNEEDRKRKMSIAKTTAAVYNTLGMIIGYGMIFVSNQSVAAYAMIIYPLLGIGVIKSSYGLTKFLSNKKRSEYNFIMLGFLMPACIMLFRSLGEYNLYTYEHLWLPFIVIGGIVGFLLVSVGINKSIGGLSWQVGFIVVLSAIYGFGTTLQTNCVFDHSEAKVFQIQ